MSYLDSQIEFSDAQAITAAAISTNVYDVLTMRKAGAIGNDASPTARPDIGNGAPDAWLVVTVNTTISGGAATGLTVTLETADDAGLTTNASVLASSGVVATAGLTKGTALLRIPLPSAKYRRYIGLRFAPAGGSYAAGAVDGYITTTQDANMPYKSGFTVQ